MNPPVLLLQARYPTDPMLTHEVGCFLKQLDIAQTELKVLNAYTDKLDVNPCDYKLVLVGGSGDFSATDLLQAWKRAMAHYLVLTVEQEIPMFCSCFGHQMLAHALGGSVEAHPLGAAVGTVPVSLTSEGHCDPLFEMLPGEFFAQVGHFDHVTDLPVGAVCLAGTERTPVYAYRLEGRPVYAAQFHVELDMNTIKERLLAYQKIYMGTDANIQAIVAGLRPTPDTDQLLKRFWQQVQTA
ncbi:MAG: type 1 glutamine amidotransferase [Gemmatimonadaceae bacterium]|nr:type 1 glutamine amidotransferase [Gloeobacterales cyanobacterium ES-bin-141]